MEKFKIVYYSSTDGELINVTKAKENLENKFRNKIEIKIYSKYDCKDDSTKFYEDALDSNFVLLTLMGGLIRLQNFEEFASKLRAKNIPLHLQSSSMANKEVLKRFSTLDEEGYTKVQRYIFNSGCKNYENLFLYLSNIVGDFDFQYEEPKEIILDGIYSSNNEVFRTLEKYEEKIGFPNKITIGVLFYRSQFIAGNTKVVDAIIKKGRDLGFNILPVFFYSSAETDVGNLGIDQIIHNFFKKDGETIIDSLINLTGFSVFSSNHQIDGEVENVLNSLGIHVIKGIGTTQTYEEWKELPKGTNLMDYSFNLVMPEFDGQIIGYPVSSKEKVEDDLTEVYTQEPIDEGIEQIIKLAGKYGSLRYIENSKKKVAIIFHNYPPGDANIGSASGLDTMESIAILLRELDKEGYNIEHVPSNGKELLEKILEHGTNERKWIDANKIKEKGIFLSEKDYNHEFKKISQKNKDEINESWGESPGKILIYGKEILIPGFKNGNIFIGMQPGRGFGDEPSKIYHSPDLVPHHQYLAYYRYLEKIFKVDAIIHVGTHGNLEWLPGKATALSKECYPNLALGTIPNFYYYIVKNPGEGIQAKRRSYATIIDYMIPSLNFVGDYEEIEEISNLLKMYYDAKLRSTEVLQPYKEKVWEEVEKLNFQDDIEYEKEEVFRNFDGFAESLNDYLNEIKSNYIKEGMHILGEKLQGEDLINMILVVMRIRNGNIPSIHEVICESLGYDYELIMENKGKIIEGTSKTYGDLLWEVNDIARNMMIDFYNLDFNELEIEDIVQKHLGSSNCNMVSILKYISSKFVPKLYQVQDEINNLIKGLDGKFIPPGRSGNISRGGADILPTGRNFYSLDPRMVPSFSAWETGKKLADGILEDYMKNNGKYPETIAIVLWATSTMRSNGDDIAEILYLMGLKPVWDKGSGRVVGLEFIPLEELNRPRIDVTVKISGLFRDTFPNLIELLDEAFEKVSQLEEDENYIYQHVKEDMEKGIALGLQKEEAKDKALLRIFGAKAGAYGTGINHAIDTKEWGDEEDLSDLYLNWGGYAYGRGKYGEFEKEQFVERLKRVDITVQNATSRETDILDNDDYYQYHGGLACAVKNITGKKPEMYCGDSSDPNDIKIKNAARELKYVYRSRVLNPNWIESMKKHGYKAAGDMSKMINYSFGWDATSSIMEDWMYEELSSKYVFDENMKQWFEENNPMALYNIIEKLLEAYKRKMWEPEETTLEKLLNMYLEMEGIMEEKGNN